MDLGLTEKVIIVTAGEGIIADHLSRVLSAEGALVVLIGNKKDEKPTLQTESGNPDHPVFFLRAELNEPGECKKTIQFIVQKYGRIDGLINIPNVHNSEIPQRESSKKFTGVLQDQLTHYYLITHFAIPFLKETRGPIVNISVKLSDNGEKYTSVDAAVKGGSKALTREWAVELLKYGIRVNAIVASGYEPKKIFEIAHAVTFLLSEKSGHTTGQAIHLNCRDEYFGKISGE